MIERLRLQQFGRWVAPWVLVVGCGRPETPPAEPPPGPPPKLGDYLPPLDQGRLEVAPPAGWYVPPRSAKYIARFTVSRTESYPSILITAASYEEIADVTDENVDEFRNEIEGRLLEEEGDSDAQDAASTVETIRAGPFLGVAYRKRAKTTADLKTIALERIVLETVVEGRKYVVELRTEAGTARQYRPHLLAVAGGMKFRGRPAESEAKDSEESSKSVP
ncbi:MAG: hypothetical protein JW809_13945 [Pirellulales bacterium]|nr:hypothetical protein [Pirellulales bacterium]